MQQLSAHMWVCGNGVCQPPHRDGLPSAHRRGCEPRLHQRSAHRWACAPRHELRSAHRWDGKLRDASPLLTRAMNWRHLTSGMRQSPAQGITAQLTGRGCTAVQLYTCEVCHAFPAAHMWDCKPRYALPLAHMWGCAPRHALRSAHSWGIRSLPRIIISSEVGSAPAILSPVTS
jgi:hypothetical protein